MVILCSGCKTNRGSYLHVERTIHLRNVHIHVYAYIYNCIYSYIIYIYVYTCFQLSEWWIVMLRELACTLLVVSFVDWVVRHHPRWWFFWKGWFTPQATVQPWTLLKKVVNGSRWVAECCCSVMEYRHFGRSHYLYTIKWLMLDTTWYYLITDTSWYCWYVLIFVLSHSTILGYIELGGSAGYKHNVFQIWMMGQMMPQKTKPFDVY